MGRRFALIVSRGRYDRSYTVRDPNDGHTTCVTFREVEALSACRAGRSRVALRRRHGQYFSDEFLEPESDVFGIGYATLTHLQFHGLIAQPEQAGPLPLTRQGDQVLDAIRRHVRAEKRAIEAASREAAA